MIQTYCGDCLIELTKQPENSIDSVITDPPYGYSFMNKGWDIDVPSVEIFKAIFRVLKEGAFLVCMSAPRQDVSSKMITRIGEAGFDIAFDPIEWVYASGFPKAQNIAKSIDRSLLYEWVISDLDRKVKYKSLPTKEKLPYLKSFRKQWAFEMYGKEIHDQPYEHPMRKNRTYQTTSNVFSQDRVNDQLDNEIKYSFGGEKEGGWKADQLSIEELISPQAIEMDGLYSYSPKPARELILIAQKPTHTKSNIDQALQFKNGGVWFDRCRIPTNMEDALKKNAKGYCGNGGTGVLGWNNGEPESCLDSDKPPINAEQQKEILKKIRIPIKRGAIQCQGNDNLQGWNSEEYPKFTDVDLRGRFPANLLVSDNVLDLGEKTKARDPFRKGCDYDASAYKIKAMTKMSEFLDDSDFSDKFSLDRWWSVYLKQIPKAIQETFPFLYVPKPTKKEKNKGLDKFTSKKRTDGNIRSNEETARKYQANSVESRNIHPTCKPIQLMTYLIELFTKPGDVVCDPFLGSGTTLIAAQIARRNGIGIELNPEYYVIAQQRIKEEKTQTTLA